MRKILLAATCLAAAAAPARRHAEERASGGVDGMRRGGGHERAGRPRDRRRRQQHEARGLSGHREADAAGDGTAADADGHGEVDGAANGNTNTSGNGYNNVVVKGGSGKSGKSQSAKSAKEEEEDPFAWNDDTPPAPAAEDDYGNGDGGSGGNGGGGPHDHIPWDKSGKSTGKGNSHTPNPDSNKGHSSSGKPNSSTPNGGNSNNGMDTDTGWGHDGHAHWDAKGTKLFKAKASKSSSKSVKSKSWDGGWPKPPGPSQPSYRPTYPGVRPPLTWLGVNGCTPEQPCDVCHGDCETNRDCFAPYECFHRTDDGPIPGCASGGPGDVPGGDYCYDPSQRPTPSMGPTSYRPTFDSTRRPTRPPSPFLDLVWKGVNGCTPETPCDACEGDCDEDADCQSSDPNVELGCYKRADGESNQVPGCNVGGEGDIPGADYCYDVSVVGAPTSVPLGTLSPTMEPPQEERDAYFIRSQAGLTPSNGGGGNPMAVARFNNLVGGRNLQQREEWCISGALSPDYYQLLMEPCTPDSLTAMNNGGSNDSDGSIIARMEQMDQLWSMDPRGHIHTIFDYDRCMMVPSSSLDRMTSANARNVEAPVEIGPCDDATALTEFYYDERFAPNSLRLQGYDDLCVTFLGGDVASKGEPLILTSCGDEDKYGWDFVLERDLGPSPSPPPASVGLPRLRYQGRDACNTVTPCDVCIADCDVDADCLGALRCFQRERGDSTQVPGCAVGGPGDIAGADYCYDPTSDGITAMPTVAPAPAPELRWLGAEGCTPETTCEACEGDCDDEADCEGSLMCFRRMVGESTPVPGCAVGGAGDIPGGDYCYDPQVEMAPPPAPRPARPNPRPPRAPSDADLSATVPKQSPISDSSSPRPTGFLTFGGDSPTRPTEPAMPLVDGSYPPTPSEPSAPRESLSSYAPTASGMPTPSLKGPLDSYEPTTDLGLGLESESEQEVPSSMSLETVAPTLKPSRSKSGKPSPSPVVAPASLPAPARGSKSSKGSKKMDASPTWSSSTHHYGSSKSGKSQYLAPERTRAHEVREGSTRTEREHAEQKMATEGRARKHGSTRWDREHDDETD